MLSAPIKKKKIRKGVYAFQYKNGNIFIEGNAYQMHSMTSAISLWRKQNPLSFKK